MRVSNINLTNTFTFYIIIEQNQYERHTLYHQLSVKSGKALCKSGKNFQSTTD